MRPPDASRRLLDAATRPRDASTRLLDASTRLLDASTRPFDGGPDTGLGCDCKLGADGVMHMSWSCFQTYIGTRNQLQWCSAPGSLESICGLVVYTYYDGAGALQEYVYDLDGAQVGGHYENAFTPFACPDQSLSSRKVESGTFPAPGCPADGPCGCTADGRTLACPPPDAGVSPYDAGACDCRIDGDGALRMSWDCFCAFYGCTASRDGWCGASGQWTTGCGLDVFTWDRLGLTQIMVFDKTGTLVGNQIKNPGTGFFECPTDYSMESGTLVSGTFPAASCATTVCPCDRDPSGGFTGTFTCPAPDGGAHQDAAAH